MIKKFLCLILLIHACALYTYKEHKPIATHITYEPRSDKIVITSWDITRLQLLASLLMGATVLSGSATLQTCATIIKQGPTEERVGRLIIASYLTAGLFAASVYCFNKAERMY